MGIIRRVHEGIVERTWTQKIGRFFWILFQYLVFFLLLTLLFTGFIAAYNANSSGATQVWSTRAETAIENTKILTPPYNVLKNVLRFTKNPAIIEEQFGWKTEIDKNKNNQDLGLKFIRNFAPLKQRYLPNEEIVLSTAVQVSSLKDDSSISFFCNVTKDFSPDKIISVSPNEPQKLAKNERKIFDVVCRIPGDAITLPSDKEVLAKKVKLNAVYDFKTKSFLDVYTMQKFYLDNLINQGGDPFEDEYKINPNLDKSLQQTIPTTTYGPMKVILRLDNTQPITEQGPFTNDNTYNLGLKIQKTSSSWFGRLNKINNVYIYLPNNFELVDDDFEEAFDFKETDFSGESFKRYKLKQEKINNLNDQCKNYRLSNDECDNLYDQGFVIAFTKFRINNLDSPTLTRDFIRAEVDYDFQAEALTTVTLVRTFV